MKVRNTKKLCFVNLKRFFALCFPLFFLIDFALSGGELSGGGITQLFQSMTPYEAFESNQFEKKIFNIHFPGTSTWYNPLYSLCRNGQNIETIHPTKSCILWSAKGGDDDNWEVKTFKRLMDAEKYSNNPDCIAYTDPVILSTPIHYTVEECVLWAAKGGNDDNWDVKTFKRKMDAEKYSNHPYCAETGIVSKTMPTYFDIEFYYGKNNPQFAGKHRFDIIKCDRIQSDHPNSLVIKVSGELSGGGVPLKNK